ncbi:glycine betaine/L-proline ABC transporter ATP-binding protein [Oceanobacillus sp. FSL K6-2867]|uniref:quaternary amine ABC transporter ATP-binding protein n=1 Tax=Oceanobacillus sp. FSL K6-2867 TaxID=2954748 RepID=UPI0030DD1DD7
MSVISVNNLTKVFGKNAKQAIKLLNEGISKNEILKKTGSTIGVNRASFSVSTGETFVIMGLSGSGKSTLIRLINRLIEPTEGSILIEGEELAKMDKQSLRKVRREKLGMVFQKFALFPHKTVLQNTAFGLEIQKMPREERERQARKSLELVGLEGYADLYPSQLSGGMQQRVGLARALANNPEVLLMDEAFSALDPLIRKEMQDELIELQSKMKKTIIFITHDLDEALRLGDRIALMKDGAIVQIGTPEEILVAPADGYVEKFVEDVDRSKILTAQHIMKRPETVNLDKHGPNVALERMREVGISGLFVVDSNRYLKGFVTADLLLDARGKGIQNLGDVMEKNILQVNKNTPMHSIFNIIYNSPIPIAVVEDKKLIGVIVRGAVIGALAKDSEVNLNYAL